MSTLALPEAKTEIVDDRHEKALFAGKHFVKHVGLDIIDDTTINPDVYDFVAVDGNTLVFVLIAFAYRSPNFPMPDVPREDFDKTIIQYLKDHLDLTDRKIRLDKLCINFIDETNRAIVKRHVNALHYD